MDDQGSETTGRLNAAALAAKMPAERHELAYSLRMSIEDPLETVQDLAGVKFVGI